MSKTRGVALIGFGAIGQNVAGFVKPAQELRLVSVLVRDLRRIPAHAVEEFGPIFTESWGDLVSRQPDILVEAAGVDAVRAYAGKALSCGMDVVVTTIGALVDDGFLARLKKAATEHGQRVLLPSGAVGGLDALGAASLTGLTSVTHTIRKPPHALLSPERAAEVRSKGEQLQIFEGSARESAIEFPQNTNATVAVSLAGVGVDETMVRVIADPGVSRNTHEIVARGAFGELTFTVRNEPFPTNPKTSQLTALSIARLLLARVSVLNIGG